MAAIAKSRRQPQRRAPDEASGPARPGLQWRRLKAGDRGALYIIENSC